jgi:hypothetical protein
MWQRTLHWTRLVIARRTSVPHVLHEAGCPKSAPEWAGGCSVQSAFSGADPDYALVDTLILGVDSSGTRACVTKATLPEHETLPLWSCWLVGPQHCHTADRSFTP